MIPEHQVYTEVFLGGGALFWYKEKAENETINDTLDIVTNFYSTVKTNFKPLKKLIDATCFSRSLHDKGLLIIRNKHMFNSIDLAWAFWITSNFSYGNKIGGGIKYSNDIGQLPPKIMANMKRQFTDLLVSRVEDAHIECRDAVQVLQSRNVPNAFHYVDPPYPNANQGHYKGYNFSHFELLLIQLEKTKGKFLLSNYNSDMLDAFIKKNDWWKKEITVKSRGMRKNETNKIEVLVANFRPVEKITLAFG